MQEPQVAPPLGTRLGLGSQEGYSVVFLSRKGSLQPFVNRLPELTQAADLDSLFAAPASAAQGVAVSGDCADVVAGAVAEAREATEQDRLVTVHFATVFEYIKYLEVVATSLQVKKWRGGAGVTIMCNCPQPTCT